VDYASLFQLAVSLYGEQKAANMSKEQLALLKNQLDQIRGVQLPDLPQVEAEQLGPSELGAMAPDEAMRGDQLQTLADMRSAIDAGGLSLSDRAALLDAMGDVSATNRRARADVKADLARRGGIDSGAQLLMGEQAASDNARDAGKAGLQAAAQAEQRKLQLMREYLAGTGQVRGQDWAENASAAGARDARAESNAARREKSKYYNAGLPQQGFANAMAKATGQMPAGNNLASWYGNEAQGQRDFWGNAGAAVGEGTRRNNSYTGGSSSGPTQKRDADGYPYDSEPEEWENPYPWR
jgi:hypothetical protein